MAVLATITEYILQRGQATSADVIDLLGSAPGTVSRQLRALCMLGKIHRVARYTGRPGCHAVYAAGPAPVDENGETEDEGFVLQQKDWPQGVARRDPMVAALFGAPVTMVVVSRPCQNDAPRAAELAEA